MQISKNQMSLELANNRSYPNENIYIEITERVCLSLLYKLKSRIKKYNSGLLKHLENRRRKRWISSCRAVLLS